MLVVDDIAPDRELLEGQLAVTMGAAAPMMRVPACAAEDGR